MTRTPHTWRRCKPGLLCTSHSEKNGRCGAAAVTRCVRKSHEDRYEPRGGCDARCGKHAPRTKKAPDFKQWICTSPCHCLKGKAALEECACVHDGNGFCRHCRCAMHEIWFSTGERIARKKA